MVASGSEEGKAALVGGAVLMSNRGGTEGKGNGRTWWRRAHFERSQESRPTVDGWLCNAFEKNQVNALQETVIRCNLTLFAIRWNAFCLTMLA